MSENLTKKSIVNSFDDDVCHGIYVLYDKRAETYGTPLCFPTSFEAKRYFASNLLQVPDVILKDFVIYEIAEYIPSKGSIVTYSFDLDHKFLEVSSDELLDEVHSMREFLKSVKDEVDKENKK